MDWLLRAVLKLLLSSVSFIAGILADLFQPGAVNP